MHEELIREYREAYAAANPEKPPVEVMYESGWFYVQDYRLATPYRRLKLIEMRDRLRARVGDGGA